MKLYMQLPNNIPQVYFLRNPEKVYFLNRFSWFLNAYRLSQFYTYRLIPTIITLYNQDGSMKHYMQLTKSSTSVVHGTWKKFSRHSTISVKKTFSFLAAVLLWCMGFRKKTQTVLDPYQGKRSFLLWLQYYQRALNLEKFIWHSTLAEKKYLRFISSFFFLSFSSHFLNTF